MFKMTEETIFNIIKGETNNISSNENKDSGNIVSELNMGSILTAIEYNLSRAKEEWYNEITPYPKTTNYLRKVASLSVKAGIMYEK